MRVRVLGPTGDFQFGASLLNFYINVPLAPGQVAKTSLQLIQGEWFLDTTAGTPYFQGVLGKFPQSSADTIVRNTIINAQGVLDIATFQSSVNTAKRSYAATATIDTVYGQAVVGFSTSSHIPVYPKLVNELITQSGYILETQGGQVLTK